MRNNVYILSIKHLNNAIYYLYVLARNAEVKGQAFISRVNDENHTYALIRTVYGNVHTKSYLFNIQTYLDDYSPKL